MSGVGVLISFRWGKCVKWCSGIEFLVMLWCVFFIMYVDLMEIKKVLIYVFLFVDIVWGWYCLVVYCLLGNVEYYWVMLVLNYFLESVFKVLFFCIFVMVLFIVFSKFLLFLCNVMLDFWCENVLLVMVSVFLVFFIRFSVVRWLIKIVLIWFMCRFWYFVGLLL